MAKKTPPSTQELFPAPQAGQTVDPRASGTTPPPAHGASPTSPGAGPPSAAGGDSPLAGAKPVEPPPGLRPVETPPGAPSAQPAAAAPPPASAPPAPAQAPAAAAQPPDGPAYKLPDGYSLHPETKSAFERFIGEAKLSPEHQQAMVDLQVQNLERVAQARAAGQQATRQQWLQQIYNDPQFGGQSFDRAREAAAKFVDMFGDDDLRLHLGETNSGYNPGLFKAFSRAAAFIQQRMSEDSLASLGMRSGGASSRTLTQEEKLERLYDSPDMQRLRQRQK